MNESVSEGHREFDDNGGLPEAVAIGVSGSVMSGKPIRPLKP